MNTCQICGIKNNNLDQINLETFAGQGHILICSDCKKQVQEFVCDMTRTCIRARDIGYQTGKEIAITKKELGEKQ